MYKHLKTDHWALHDALEEDEVQVIGSGGARAVTQSVQHLRHCWRTEGKRGLVKHLPLWDSWSHIDTFSWRGDIMFRVSDLFRFSIWLRCPLCVHLLLNVCAQIYMGLMNKYGYTILAIMSLQERWHLKPVSDTLKQRGEWWSKPLFAILNLTTRCS